MVAALQRLRPWLEDTRTPDPTLTCESEQRGQTRDHFRVLVLDKNIKSSWLQDDFLAESG